MSIVNSLFQSPYFVKKICHTREGGYPELFENTGFPLEFIPFFYGTGMTFKDPNRVFQQAVKSDPISHAFD